MTDFEKAAKAIRESAKAQQKMTDDEMNQIYALYKQGTVGDNTTTEAPGMLDLKGKARFEAWGALKHKTK